MASRRIRTIIVIEIAALVLLGLGAGAALGYRAALGHLRDETAAYLGGGTEIGSVDVTLQSVVITDLRIPGGKGWPVKDQFRAHRIEVFPSVRALLRGSIEAGTILVDEPYVSAVRTRSGHLRIVPTILEAPTPDVPPIHMKLIEIRDAHGELLDYSVGKKPARLKMHAVQARVRGAVYPKYDTRTDLAVSGVVDGRDNDGTMQLRGWLVPSTYDSDLQVELRHVDLVPMQPYLESAGAAEVEKGRVDLDMTAAVDDKVLSTRGEMTLIDLELEKGSRGVQKFMGVPAGALFKLMADHNGRVTVKFAATERIDDPNFKIHAVIARAVRDSLAENLGLDLKSTTRTVTGTSKKVVGDVEETLQGFSEDAAKTVEGLFGKKK